jgi:predicted aldo/keto reductase-like oxidoreductase
MKYRKFGTLDWQASIIGFGCMRFPTGNKKGDILEQKSREMLYYAIDHDVNYLSCLPSGKPGINFPAGLNL